MRCKTMNRMTKTLPTPIAVAAVVAGLLVGPGCLVVADVSLPDLVGDWVATEARLANVADLNERLDVTDLGWEVTLRIEADGEFTLVLLEPGEPPNSRTGTLVVDNGKDLILTRGNGMIGEGEVFLEGDQVAFMFDKFAGFEADIRGDGKPIPVTLLLVMVR